ncbi:MAG: SDR family oxidoreductase [Bryobacteraceae bacterium]|nr:SDR family oxidoreductase [Bryobacteraceae bacterium]MDW8379449.1 SDR family oxidoreductase [Bryobacterales bacterium]
MSVLKDRFALVTGGSRGIGRAIAELFAKVGATVFICGRKQYALDQVVQDNAMLPGRLIPIQCNVTRLEELEAMVDTIHREVGALDVLVNNAATNLVSGYALDLGEAEFDRAVETNLKSVYRLTRLVAPEMCKRGSGSIINIAAVAGIKPEPVNLLYSMTKAAVIMMTKCYALELAPRGVRVNAIAPGLVQTEMSGYIWKDEHRLAEHLRLQPVRHLGQPEEVAEIALMLASERASFVTGQTFIVDGGLLLA